MTDQPEALKMANRLDDESSIQGVFGTRVAVRLCADVARLLRDQHAEIERLRAEIERAFDSGYDKGVQDTLLDHGVEP